MERLDRLEEDVTVDDSNTPPVDGAGTSSLNKKKKDKNNELKQKIDQLEKDVETLMKEMQNNSGNR